MAEASGAEEGCVPGGAVVDGKSGSGGYVIIVVLELFNGWGGTWSYTFACPHKPRERFTMSVVEAYYVSGS